MKKVRDAVVGAGVVAFALVAGDAWWGWSRLARQQSPTPTPAPAPVRVTDGADGGESPLVAVPQNSTTRPDRFGIAAAKIVPWQPPLPHVIAAGFSAPSQALVEWLHAWEERLLDEAPTSERAVGTLDQLIASAQLSSDEAVQLLRVAQKWEEPADLSRDAAYTPVSGSFACRAIYAGVAEIDADPGRHDAVMKVMAGPLRRLWFGQPRDARAVEAYYVFVAAHSGTGSPDWHRGRVGAIESIKNQLRYADALAAAEALEREAPDVSPSQAASLAYAKGAVLFHMERYADAVAPLTLARKDLGASQRADARILLVMSLARAGKPREARQEYELYASSGDQSVLAQQAVYVVRAAMRAAEKKAPQ